jgi:hypothetical protein
MPTYIVFDRTTGDVLHAHVEPEEMRSAPEDVLRLVDADIDRSSLEVVAVAGPSAVEGQALRVDPETGRLLGGPAATGGNGGGGLATAAVPELLAPAVRTKYTS